MTSSHPKKEPEAYTCIICEKKGLYGYNRTAMGNNYLCPKCQSEKKRARK